MAAETDINMAVIQGHITELQGQADALKETSRAMMKHHEKLNEDHQNNVDQNQAQRFHIEGVIAELKKLIT